MFCDGGFLAHVTRTLEVGRALYHCFGHRIVFCCDGPYAHIARDAGFEVRPVFTVDREITMKLARRFGPCGLSWWRGACEESFESDLQAIDAIRPDAVVGDMRWSLATSARVAGVPYIAIANACWTSFFTERIQLPEGHFLANLVGGPLARAAFPTLARLMQSYYALGYTKIRRSYRLPRLHTLYEAIEGDITLLADLPEFMPVRPDTPLSYRHTGPLLWDAKMALPPWFSKLQPGRPTIYFTMGSTGDSRFFAEAVRVFGDTEFQVLITTGGLAEVPGPPDNVFVAKYAPGEALMTASDVVVSHGGNGTVYQALSRGVPIIGFASIFDQEINLRRVHALGVGIHMSRVRYDGPSLRRAVTTILGDPTYRERSRRLADRISEMDGRRCAALHIDDFLAHRDCRRLPREVKETLRHLPSLPVPAAVA